jgi:hypothetical protein
MMDWRFYADDIIESCATIRRFIAGMSYEAFVADGEDEPSPGVREARPPVALEGGRRAHRHHRNRLTSREASPVAA